jgi:hypothetical protein
MYNQGFMAQHGGDILLQPLGLNYPDANLEPWFFLLRPLNALVLHPHHLSGLHAVEAQPKRLVLQRNAHALVDRKLSGTHLAALERPGVRASHTPCIVMWQI